MPGLAKIPASNLRNGLIILSITDFLDSEIGSKEVQGLAHHNALAVRVNISTRNSDPDPASFSRIPELIWHLFGSLPEFVALVVPCYNSVDLGASGWTEASEALDGDGTPSRRHVRQVFRLLVSLLKLMRNITRVNNRSDAFSLTCCSFQIATSMESCHKSREIYACP
jgi:hypothetical protein